MAKGSSIFPILLIGGGITAFLIVFSFVALVVPEVPQPDLFSTLSQIQAYTKKYPENPTRDNKSIVKPDYETFYVENTPAFVDKTFGNLFRVMGLAVPLSWSSRAAADLMQTLIKKREEKSYKNSHILKLNTPNNARFIIFGDQQGALHSLARNLAKLKELDILDENLKVKSDKDFILFLGDAVSRSAYSLEVLMIAMRLVEKNPEHMFYVRGNHETDNYWQNYGLKKQLEMVADSVKKDGEKFPMESMVQRFFNTLSVAVYVGVPSSLESKFVRFSHEGGDEFTIEKINIGLYAEFLKKPSQDLISSFPIAGLSGSGDADGVETKAIIRCEVKRKSFQSMDGLRQLAPEDGVPSWTIFSAPTAIYQEGVSFFNDAFGIVQTTEDIDEWKITLYYQDVRKLDGYKTRTCNLISGEEVTE